MSTTDLAVFLILAIFYAGNSLAKAREVGFDRAQGGLLFDAIKLGLILVLYHNTLGAHRFVATFFIVGIFIKSIRPTAQLELSAARFIDRVVAQLGRPIKLPESHKAPE
ncbi:MAG TPA: hypothetical protein VK968_01640 [Roseimicrobium sp.]|nr:hypothetical protein [Roseimicrobium sp.]